MTGLTAAALDKFRDKLHYDNLKDNSVIRLASECSMTCQHIFHIPKGNEKKQKRLLLLKAKLKM